MKPTIGALRDVLTSLCVRSGRQVEPLALRLARIANQAAADHTRPVPVKQSKKLEKRISREWALNPPGQEAQQLASSLPVPSHAPTQAERAAFAAEVVVATGIEPPSQIAPGSPTPGDGPLFRVVFSDYAKDGPSEIAYDFVGATIDDVIDWSKANRERDSFEVYVLAVGSTSIDSLLDWISAPEFVTIPAFTSTRIFGPWPAEQTRHDPEDWPGRTKLDRNQALG